MFERNVTVVRCKDGHLFSTIWVPGMSFKAVRLGRRRWQRCPVGSHWTTVEPVDPASLSSDELAGAQSRRNIAIP